MKTIHHEDGRHRNIRIIRVERGENNRRRWRTRISTDGTGERVCVWPLWYTHIHTLVAQSNRVGAWRVQILEIGWRVHVLDDSAVQCYYQ